MNWVSLPIDVLERLEGEGLSRDDRLLYVEGLLYAGHYLTDGTVTPRIPKLGDHPQPDEGAARLVEAGVWDETERGAFVIVDYLETNLTREEINRRKADLRERQERSRRHKSGDHSMCLKGPYCKFGTIEPKTRDVTRDVTRPNLPTSPDLPDLKGKVGQGERKVGDDDGRSAPDGAHTPASPPHVYADPQRLGHCCHCQLPAKNAAHHQGVPEALKQLADVTADIGALMPTRNGDEWGSEYWDAVISSDPVTWTWQTREVPVDTETCVDSLQLEIPTESVVERSDAEWDALNAETQASLDRFGIGYESDQFDGNDHWSFYSSNSSKSVNVVPALYVFRRLVKAVLTPAVQP